MLTTIAPRLYVRDITDEFDLGSDVGKIKKIEEVYLYDANYRVGQDSLHRCVFLYMTVEFAGHVGEHKRKGLYEKYVWHSGEDVNVPADEITPAAFLNDETFEDMGYDEAFAKVVEFYTCNHYY